MGGAKDSGGGGGRVNGIVYAGDSSSNKSYQTARGMMGERNQYACTTGST